MPELPEVETIRLQLDKVLKGLVIEGIEVLREKSFIVPLRPTPQMLRGATRELRGLKVMGVRRRAKVQFIELENGTSLAIHLKMTGQLIWREPNQEGAEGKKVSRGDSGTTSTTGTTSEGTTELLRRPLAIPQGGRLGETSDALVTVDRVKGKPYEVDELPNKYTRVIISFSDGSKPNLSAGRLYFNDLRVFGWIRIINSKLKSQNAKPYSKSKNNYDDLDKYGPEAIDEEAFSLEYFRNILGKTSRAVKLAILDQEKLAGVGNIYANEALFRSGVLPTKEAKKMRNEEIEKLRNEIIKVLREAIEHGGTSDKDEAFRQINGSKGGYQKFLQVYNREGEACLKCGKPILKIKIGGRGSYYCSVCQK